MAWWDLPKRSGRPWAAGTAYWYDRPGEPLSATARLTSEELDVSLLDAMAASSKGNNFANIQTWDQVIGGPVGTTMTTGNDTQFDWRTSTFYGMGHCIAWLPKGGAFATDGSGWISWTISTIPASEKTSLVLSTIWGDVASGDHDAKYIKFGERVVTKMAASGHPLKRLLIDANHEMNQSNYHQIWADNRIEYKAAMQRTIAKIREGADNITPGAGAILKFVHRPGFKVDDADTNIGHYNTYVPIGIDVLSLSCHPDGRFDTAAKIDQWFAGTLLPTKFTGLNELLETATDMNLPIAFPEWSPVYNTLPGNGGACPLANTFIQKFYNQILVPNQARLVCDCIWNQNVRDKGAYTETTDTAGMAEWNAMVDTRKVLWNGIQSDATVPSNDSFSYTVSDDWGQRTANVAVTIQGGNVSFVSAQPDTASTAPGTAVVISVLDNDTASANLLPLMIDNVGLVNPGGTTAITADNKIRYTPPTGVSSVEANFFYTARPSSAATPTSTAEVRVQITGTTTQPVGGDYPDTPNDVTLTAGGDLRAKLLAAYAAATPNTTIWLQPGTYTGSFTFNKAGATATSKIVIRPLNNNWLAPVFTGRVFVNGAHHMFVGASFTDFGTGYGQGVIDIAGASSRVSRCKINYTGTGHCAGVVVRATDVIVDRMDIRIWKGAAGGNGEGRGIGLEPPGREPTGILIDRCWIHGANGRSAELADTNFHESIQLGRGVDSGFKNLHGTVRMTLIEENRNESEVVSVKSGGNTFDNVILRNCTGRLSSRLGANNTYRACRTEGAAGFIDHDRENRWIGCVGGTFQLTSGNISIASYYANSSGKNIVAAGYGEMHHCTGTVVVGYSQRGGGPVLSYKVLSHSGTINNDLGTAQTGTSTLARPTIVALPTPAGNANDRVGPFAP